MKHQHSSQMHMLGEFAGVSSFEACVIKHSAFNLVMLSIKQVRRHNTELETVQAEQATCMSWFGL